MTNYLQQELYQKISQSPELFNFIQEAALDGLWYWDLEQPEQEWMNPKFWTLLGFDPKKKKHLSNEWQELIDQEDLRCVQQNLEQHLADPNYPFDQIVCYRHRLGHNIWVRCRGLAIRNDQGVPIRLLGAHTDITDLMLQQEELEKTHRVLQSSEAKFRGLFESSPVGIAMNDYHTGEFLDFNAAINESAGYTRDEFSRLSYWEITPKRYEYQEAQQIKSMEVTGRYGPYQKEYIHKDGTRYPVLLNGFKTTTPEGREVIWSIIQDVSEIENARQQLEETRNLLDSLVNNIPGLTFRCRYDEYWTMLFMTRAIDPLTGYTTDELINNASVSYAELIHPEDSSRLERIIAQSVEENQPWDIKYRVSHKDGSLRWAHERGHALRDKEGKVEYLDGFILDITDQVIAEQELAGHRKLLDNFFNQSVSGFFFMMLDKPIDWQYASAEEQERLLDYALNHLRMTKVNQAMLDQYGALEKDFLGLTYAQFFSAEEIEKGRSILKEIFDQGRVHAETHEQRQDGSLIIIKGDYTGLYDEQGRITGHFGIQQDVTEQKLQEQMLQKAKAEAEAANQIKSEFLANMSHEIRTPINGILGMSELGLKEQDPEKMRHQLQRVNQSGRLLLGIINDLLDFSKVEAGKLELAPQTFRLEQLRDELNSLFKSMASEKGLKFRVIGQPKEIFTICLHGDSQRLRQVLINLVGNAIKFTATGEVTLNMRQQEAHVGPDSMADWFEFFVQDTGIGISSKQQDKLFQAFTQADTSITRQHGGTGLGLVISQRLVRLMGGKDIVLESKPGQGSTFSFALPLRICTAQEVAVFQQTQRQHISHQQPLAGRVLLVEDNEINQEVVVSLLKSLNVDFVIANHGQEAVEKVQEADFDLILMDIQMPVMDGYEATRQIRQLNIELPIVALTAAAMIEDRNKAMSVGMQDHLAKPIEPVQLYNLLTQYLPAEPVQLAIKKPVLLLVCADKEHLKNLAKQAHANYKVRIALNTNQAADLITKGGLDEVWLVETKNSQRAALQSLQELLQKARVHYQYQKCNSC